jgi:hypothetical protein
MKGMTMMKRHRKSRTARLQAVQVIDDKSGADAAPAEQGAEPKARHDGWTPARKTLFWLHLANWGQWQRLQKRWGCRGRRLMGCARAIQALPMIGTQRAMWRDRC